jgi:hypothetical protein
VMTAQQRLGLGLLWVPGSGSVLQSQTAGTTTAWGTRSADTSLVYEASTFVPTLRAANAPVAVTPGNRDLSNGDVVITYPLGSRGEKSVLFDDDGTHVRVRHQTAFVEQLPLLVLPADSLESSKGLVTLRRGNTVVSIRWSPGTLPSVERTSERSGDRRVVAVGIPATGALTYDVTFLSTKQR